MTETPLPRMSAGELLPFESLLVALLDHDQYDDWVPDVVYYRDHRQRLESSAAELERLWSADALPPLRPIDFTIPREKSEECPSTVLALPFRAAVYRVTAAMAPRLERNLLRDRVHGFELLTEGDGALFSSPAGGVVSVWDGAVARVDWERYLQLVDINAYNASCEPARLLQTLQRCGARADEVLFLRALLGGQTRGLPSVDDAFAYLYNYYLQPVDATLHGEEISFLRHRDMYFLFNEESVPLTRQLIDDIGLGSRTLAENPDLYDFVDLPLDYDEQDTLDTLPMDTEPLLWLELPTARIKITFNLDWTGEAELMDVWISDLDPEDRTFSTTARLAEYAERTFDRLDGVTLQPLLRRIHETRATAVSELPPYDRAPEVFHSYRRELEPVRERLADTVAWAIENKAPWHACWASALLSDLGPLPADRAESLLAGLATPAARHPLTRIHVGLLLARCSGFPATKLWQRPEAMAGFELRAALLTAFYLQRRGESAPWESCQEIGRRHEPLLTELLDAHLQLQGSDDGGGIG